MVLLPPQSEWGVVNKELGCFETQLQANATPSQTAGVSVPEKGGWDASKR